MTNLKDFITSVLVDIDIGVKAAEQKTGKKHVLDTYYNNGEHGEKGILFDIAIMAGSEASGKAGGEIKVVGTAFIGAKVDAKILNEKVSRIKFTVLRNESSTLDEESEQKVCENQYLPDVQNKVF